MVRKTNNGRRLARVTQGTDSARTVWLAGLGAVSLAQKRGVQWIETLVAEGEDFKQRSERFANTMVRDLRRAAHDARAQMQQFVAPLRSEAVRVVRELETGVGDRVGKVFGRLGIGGKAAPRRKQRRPAGRVKAKVSRRRVA